jgi:hypothetical protein
MMEASKDIGGDFFLKCAWEATWPREVSLATVLWPISEKELLVEISYQISYSTIHQTLDILWESRHSLGIIDGTA